MTIRIIAMLDDIFGVKISQEYRNDAFRIFSEFDKKIYCSNESNEALKKEAVLLIKKLPDSFFDIFQEYDNIAIVTMQAKSDIVCDIIAGLCDPDANYIQKMKSYGFIILKNYPMEQVTKKIHPNILSTHKLTKSDSTIILSKQNQNILTIQNVTLEFSKNVMYRIICSEIDKTR